MSTEIYYFSDTGNSLVVARDIAVKMNGKMIPIPSVTGDGFLSHLNMEYFLKISKISKF
jgi:flavodoxin